MALVIRGKTYELVRTTDTAYVRLAMLLRPVDGTEFEDLDLRKPDEVPVEEREKVESDRIKMAQTIQQRLEDDLTSRRLAYAIKSICPGLADDGLVTYRQIALADGSAELDFDIASLYMAEIIAILTALSEAIEEQPAAPVAAPQASESKKPFVKNPKKSGKKRDRSSGRR